MIHNIMDELLIPLIKRVFDFLNTSPSGTDEAVLLVDLRKAYINFITGLFNAQLESVLVSERNVGYLNTILQTLMHFAKDNNDPTVQKMAFGVFMKMVTSWGSGANIAGFSQFVYNELVPATFTVPTHASFNVADGQSLLVSKKKKKKKQKEERRRERTLITVGFWRDYEHSEDIIHKARRRVSRIHAVCVLAINPVPARDSAEILPSRATMR